MKVKFENGGMLHRVSGDAGYDMVNAGPLVRIAPGGSAVIPTGVSLQLPLTMMGDLTHRSSLAWKKDCILSRGIIDPSYTGEIKAKVYNIGKHVRFIAAGERFCQLIFTQTIFPELEVTQSIEEGKDGFGSSGL